MLQENYLNKEQWIFGTIFYYKYITSFNKEQETITFYSSIPFNKDKYVKNMELQKSKIHIDIFLFITITLCMWSCILIIQMLLKNEK